ncbi:Polyketide synthase PksM [compost metagenome]
MPFALERADLYRPCSAEMWCIVSRSAKGVGKVFDIQLLNLDGELCGLFSALTIKDFSAAKTTQPATGAPSQADSGINVSLAIEWLARPPVASPPVVPGRVLQIGLDDGAEQAWGQLLAQRFCAPHQALESLASCQALLERAGHFDEILWIAPPSGHDPVQAQQSGVSGLFRLVKALLAQGAHTRPLSLTVLTCQAQSVLDGEAVHAAHASVHGLVGVMAKEMRKWRMRLVDLDEARSLPLAEVLRLPHEPNGEAWAWRAGQWYRQCLMPCHQALGDGPSVLRRHGVYVIVGGSGGIGKAMSRYLIEHYSANVIWLGRRGLAQGISQELESFADLSHAPIYFQVDATDEAALTRVHGQIKQRFGHIHGVINSAIVLQDQSMLNLDEHSFNLVLGVKVASSVNVARAFAGEPLDFMLFFSSLVAFLKTAGQSNYAAGSVFQDTFAHHLQRTSGFPVKVMNWGYWGEFGAGASDHYRKRMASNGVASLDSVNGMAAVEFLLRSSLSHMGFIRMFEFKALNIMPGMLLNQALDISTGRTLVNEVEPILVRANQQLRTLLPKGDALREDLAAMAASAPQPRLETSPLPLSVATPAVPGPVTDLRGQALAHMKRLVSQALQVPLEELDESTPLVRYGVDSISAVYITNALGEIFGPVDGTLLFDLQTIEELADHFLARHPDVYAAFFNAAAPEQPTVNVSAPEPFVDLGGASLRANTLQHMRTLVSRALEVPLDELDDSTPLVRYGVDSISAVYITNALSEIFGPVDGSLLFDIQTIDELADHFLSSEALVCANLFGGSAAPAQAMAPAASPAEPTPVLSQVSQMPLLRINRDHDVAVVGMAGRYPQAVDLAAFWDNLIKGVHSIEEIPAQRWDWRLGFSLDVEKVGGCYTRWGGFIEGHDEFDPVFFHISPAEAELMNACFCNTPIAASRMPAIPRKICPKAVTSGSLSGS